MGKTADLDPKIKPALDLIGEGSHCNQSSVPGTSSNVTGGASGYGQDRKDRQL